jgi:hypothetical protein
VLLRETPELLEQLEHRPPPALSTKAWLTDTLRRVTEKRSGFVELIRQGQAQRRDRQGVDVRVRSTCDLGGVARGFVETA